MSHVCEHCGEAHRYPISAALCCDIISNTVNVDPEEAVS